jgi:ELWxxDGT repeat protein
MSRTQGRVGRTAWIGGLGGFLVAISLVSAASAAPGDVTVSQVADIRPGLMGSGPQELIDAGGTLLFSAADATNGTELWRSNGGPLGPGGTEMVANIESGSLGSTPQELTAIGATVFFNAFRSADGRELWKIDPPYTTPVQVEDINPTSSSGPSDLTNVNGTLLFRANDGTNGEELWKSAPPYNAASTDIVKNITTGSAGSSPNGLFNADGTLLFDADDGAGSALWKSASPYDETSTTKVPGGASFPGPYADVGGTVLFGAVVSGDFELWKIAPPFTAPVQVKNINPTGDSDVEDFVNVNGTVFMEATDGSGVTQHGFELWMSAPPYDSTSTTVLDINPGNSDSVPTDATNIGGTLFLGANDGVHGSELWKSNGGPVGAGTELVADINPTGGSSPAGFENVNGTAFFRAFNTGPELYRSTGVGATKLTSIFSTGSAPQLLTDVAGTLFFAATDSGSTTGQELWKATIEPNPPPPASPSTPAAPTPTKKKCKKKHKKRAAIAKKCKKKKK